MSRPQRRLTKRDVEALMAGIDDDPVTALTVALRRVLGAPQADWTTLVEASGLPADTRRALLCAEPAALWDLATVLNEERTLPAAP